jgi:hypothetical protein
MTRARFPDRRLDIRRTLDATRLNVVANDPVVRPHLLVAGEGPLDLAALVGDPRNYCFETEAGGFLGVALGYGRYEVHSLFVPTRSPRLTVLAMRAASEYMFTRTDCTELVTKVPEGNRRAGQLAALAHFETRFETTVVPGATTRARYLVLPIDTWAVHGCGLVQYGEWFHQSLEAAKEASQSQQPAHPDDPLHDQMVGATVLMIYGGQVEKAIGFYNRWARWAGYTPILVVSIAPPVFDIGDAIIEARLNDMEVLVCR